MSVISTIAMREEVIAAVVTSEEIDLSRIRREVVVLSNFFKPRILLSVTRAWCFTSSIQSPSLSLLALLGTNPQ